MLSDEIWMVVRRLEYSALVGEPLAPVDAEILAGILRTAAEDAAALEAAPLGLGHGPVTPAPDPWGNSLMCRSVLNPVRAGVGNVIPFPRKPRPRPEA